MCYTLIVSYISSHRTAKSSEEVYTLSVFVSFFMSIITVLCSFFGCATKVETNLKENLPDVTPDAQNNYYDVAYGDAERQTLDLFLPQETSQTMPLIILIHGGGWIAGDKSAHRDFGISRSQDGVACLLLNYHYADVKTRCDVMLNDITLAVERAIDVAALRGITFSCAAIGGGSAGGHLALLYATKCADASPVELKFCFAMAGPADLTGKEFVTDNSLGDDQICMVCTYLTGKMITECNYESNASQSALAEISPITYVNADTIPMLMIHGQKDDIVPYNSSVAFANKLSEYGVKYDLIPMPNSGHAQDKDPAAMDEFGRLLDEYISEYLNP